MIDMAYTMNRKLNEFKSLKQAILDGDFKKNGNRDC